jgi:Flp pilus assembly protein CpaB
VKGEALGIAQSSLRGRTRRALPTRLSSGHVVMLLAGALGVMLTLSVLRAADDTQPVLVAARELSSGTLIGERDVRVARVRVDGDVLATLFAGPRVGALRGQVVTKTIREGAFVGRADVREPGAHAATRVMSFPLPRARAVGGKLTGGDRVDVVAVERNTARSGYVLADAEVIAVESRGGGPLAGASDEVTVSLVVDGGGAPRLAAALDTGTVTLVRATGASPLGDPPPFTPTGGSGK